MRRSLIWLFISLLSILPACNTAPGANGETAALPTITPTTPTITITPPPATTPQISTAVITVTQPVQSFIIWIPADLATRADDSPALLTEQLAQAAAAHPELQIRIEQKAISGQGGVLSYLRAGRNVAPGIMPDLIILRTDQLTSAASDALIHPVNTLLDPLLFEDLYPAANQLVQQDNRTWGYPFALTGLSHLAYNNALITTTLPATWETFTAVSTRNLVFPAAGRDGALLGLRLYLSAGGMLVNEAGQPDLQLEPLTQALEQLSAARQNEFILPQSSTLTTLRESWQIFQNGAAVMVVTTADQFLQNQANETSVGFAPVPGIIGRITPFVSGWAWSITTSDPVKQTAAADIITFMSSEANLSAWAYQAHLLPSRRAAMQLWPQENAYTRFAQRELELALAFPGAANSAIINAMGNAVFDVVSLTKSAQVAAEEAVAALQQ